MQKPTGVVLIAALYFIVAAFFLLAGAAAFFIGGAFLAHAVNAGLPLRGIAGGVGAFIGAVSIVFGVLALVVAIGLLGLKNWARMIAMVLAAIGAIFGFLAIFSLLAHFAMIRVFFRLVRIAINVLIVWYLNQPAVKQAFGA
jgi:hypothetical protein